LDVNDPENVIQSFADKANKGGSVPLSLLFSVTESRLRE
jgi:hypothetical protein